MRDISAENSRRVWDTKRYTSTFLDSSSIGTWKNPFIMSRVLNIFSRTSSIRLIENFSFLVFDWVDDNRNKIVWIRPPLRSWVQWFPLPTIPPLASLWNTCSCMTRVWGVDIQECRLPKRFLWLLENLLILLAYTLKQASVSLAFDCRLGEIN